MKTAVSIPDQIFKSADRMANESGQSRSQLYAQAVASYVEKHRGDHITKKLNEIYSDLDSRLEPEIADLQSKSLPKEEW
jgi:metal-responsive CopG/Arc/MetJ family transcriptional regulator